MSNILELSSELQRYAKYEQAMLIEKHIPNEMKAVEEEIVKQQMQFNSVIDFTLQGKNLLHSMLLSIIADNEGTSQALIQLLKNLSHYMNKCKHVINK